MHDGTKAAEAQFCTVLDKGLRTLTNFAWKPLELVSEGAIEDL